MKKRLGLARIILLSGLGLCLLPVRGVADAVSVAAVDLLSAGDIFPSPSLIQGGYQPGGTRDYTPYYRLVKPYIEGADIATAWFGGPVASPGDAFTGYPTYNNPPEFVQAAQAAGFDTIFHTNHLLDKGVKGFRRTLQYYREIGLKYLGAYETEAESRQSYIVEKNGIRMAFLSYLYALNTGPPPQKWMVNLIDPQKIKTDIERARKDGAEFIVVAMHWGIEYKRHPGKEQQHLAAQIASYGADLVLGSHPHVIQPAAMLETKTAAGKVHRTFVIYSCGNYLSSQTDRYSDCGLMLKCRIERDPVTGEVALKRTSYVPTWVKWSYDKAAQKYTILALPIYPCLKQYERKELDFLTPADYAAMKTAWQDTITHLDNASIGFLHEE